MKGLIVWVVAGLLLGFIGRATEAQQPGGAKAPVRFADKVWFSSHSIQETATAWVVTLEVNWSVADAGWVRPLVYDADIGENGSYREPVDEDGNHSVWINVNGVGSRTFTYSIAKSSTYGAYIGAGLVESVHCTVGFETFVDTYMATGDQADVRRPN